MEGKSINLNLIVGLNHKDELFHSREKNQFIAGQVRMRRLRAPREEPIYSWASSYA